MSKCKMIHTVILSDAQSFLDIGVCLQYPRFFLLLCSDLLFCDAHGGVELTVDFTGYHALQGTVGEGGRREDKRE